ncbi:MAG: hypothetical protein AAFQ87_07870 [Bacteroidota bacterium]
MAELEIIQQTGVAAKFEAYPDEIRPKLWRLRQLIIDTASEIEGINRLEESLKWGEPSYQCRKGSPIRMDWKERAPEQYAIYFNCSTSLVETFLPLGPRGSLSIRKKSSDSVWIGRRDSARGTQSLYRHGFAIPPVEAFAVFGSIVGAQNLVPYL